MNKDTTALADERNLKEDFLSFARKANIILMTEEKEQNSSVEKLFRAFVAKARKELDAERRKTDENAEGALSVLRSALEKDILRHTELLSRALSRRKKDYECVVSPINIFSILRIQRQEDAQSYFLAWLLDPNKPHGFGDGILKLLIERACDISGIDVKDRPKVRNPKVTAQKYIPGDGVVDIEIVDQEFICTIENKVGAPETISDGVPQTVSYAEYYARIVKKDQKLLLLYLLPSTRFESKEEKGPADECFRRISYSTIVEIVDSALAQAQPPSENSSLVRMFVNNIRSRICREFRDYVQAQMLLVKAEGDYLGFFARPETYDFLVTLTEKLSKEV